MTAAEFFEGLPGRFHADRATGVEAAFQFVLTGDGGGTWHAIVHDGTCTVAVGEHPAPTIAITVSAENWLKIVAGTMDPQTAFMLGRLKLKGDIGLAMRLRSLFF
jgi:putative sterol carrier protein